MKNTTGNSICDHESIQQCFERMDKEEDRLAELQYFEYDMPKFWDNIDWELYEQIKFAKKIKA